MITNVMNELDILTAVYLVLGLKVSLHHPKIVQYIGSDFLVFPFLQTIKTNTIGTLNMLGEIFIF